MAERDPFRTRSDGCPIQNEKVPEGRIDKVFNRVFDWVDVSNYRRVVGVAVLAVITSSVVLGVIATVGLAAESCQKEVPVSPNK